MQTDRKGSKNPYTGKLHVRPRPNVELFMRRTKLLNLGRPKLRQDRLLPARGVILGRAEPIK